MSTPAPPAPGTAAASDGGYFGSSKLKVIGLITVGSVVVGGLGGIAGVAFDPEPAQQPPLVSPGDTSGTTLQPQSGSLGSGSLGSGNPGSPGSFGSGNQTLGGGRAGLTASQPSAAPLPQITLSPSAGTDTTQPSPSASSGTTDGSGSAAGGSAVTLTASGVDIFVPEGWSVDNQQDDQVSFSDGQGNFAFALSGASDPTATAGDLLNANLDGLLPPENYTQREVDTPTDLGAFGSVVSVAGTDYDALWVDNQGSATLHGQLYAAVRQDGTALVIEVEHVPAADWDTAFATVEPIVVNTLRRFGGVEG